MYSPVTDGLIFPPNSRCCHLCLRCMALVTTSTARSGDCKQQIRLDFLDFILFTDYLGRLLMVQKSSKGIFLLLGLKMWVAFSNPS